MKRKHLIFGLAYIGHDTMAAGHPDQARIFFSLGDLMSVLTA